MSEIESRALNTGHTIRAQSDLNSGSFGFGSSWGVGPVFNAFSKISGTFLLVHLSQTGDIGWQNNAWNGLCAALEYSVDGGATWIRPEGVSAQSGYVIGMNGGGLGRQAVRQWSFDILINSPQILSATSVIFRIQHRSYGVGATISNSRIVIEEILPAISGSRSEESSNRPIGAIINVVTEQVAGTGGNSRTFANIAKRNDTDIMVHFNVPYRDTRGYSGSNGVTMYYEYSEDGGTTWLSLGSRSSWSFRVMHYNNVRDVFYITGLSTNQIRFRVIAGFFTAVSAIGSGYSSGMDTHIVVREFRRWDVQQGGAEAFANTLRGKVFNVANFSYSGNFVTGTTEAIVYTSPVIQKVAGSGIIAGFYFPMRNDHPNNWGGALLRFEYSVNGSTWIECGYSGEFTPIATWFKYDISHWQNEIYIPAIASSQIQFRVKGAAWDTGSLYVNQSTDAVGSQYLLSIKVSEVL